MSMHPGITPQAATGVSPSAHTSGPWQIRDDYTREGSLTIIGNVDGEYFTDSPSPVMSCEFVASLVDEYDETHASTEANSRLIIAAPDLLAALQKIVDAEPEEYVRRIASAAIAKATGVGQ